MQRANEALWLVGLGEERFRPVGSMSTGQRQRVKLAAAIAHDPELVLLDEPTDGLDPMQRTEMLDLIRRIGTEFGLHILVSSHHLEEVERICDSVVIVEGGEVVHAERSRTCGRGRRASSSRSTTVRRSSLRLLTATGLEVDRRRKRAPARRRRRRARRGTRRRCRPLDRVPTARASRPYARGRLPGSRCMTRRAHSSTSATAATTARRERPARAICTLAVVHRPACARPRTRRAAQGAARNHARDRFPSRAVSMAFAVIARRPARRRPHLLRRLHVHHRQRARPLRVADRARGALPRPALGDARPVPRRPARPHPLPGGEGDRGLRGHAPDHPRPAALHARSPSSSPGTGPKPATCPVLLLRILATGSRPRSSTPRCRSRSRASRPAARPLQSRPCCSSPCR